MFIDVWTRSLQGDVTDTRIFTRLENTRKNLHKELDLMFQVEAQTIKAEVMISEQRMEAKIEVARHEFQTVERS
jgi:hypothetical protein